MRRDPVPVLHLSLNVHLRVRNERARAVHTGLAFTPPLRMTM
jgi:hypothetical protein